MEDWLVNLIIGLASVILGFVGGFFTNKAITSKNKQKIKKGSNNSQTINITK